MQTTITFELDIPLVSDNPRYLCDHLSRKIGRVMGGYIALGGEPRTLVVQVSRELWHTLGTTCDEQGVSLLEEIMRRTLVRQIRARPAAVEETREVEENFARWLELQATGCKSQERRQALRDVASMVRIRGLSGLQHTET